MKRCLALLLLLLSGCATAPPRIAGDPLACAYRVAESVPPDQGRSNTLNAVAITAWTCDSEFSAPPAFWAQNPDHSLPVMRTMAGARAAMARGDTAQAAQGARVAWDQAGARSLRQNRVDTRQQALELLIEARHFDVVLARCRRIEHGRDRAEWFDPTTARRQVAFAAARLDDRAILERALADADSTHARALVLAGATGGFASAGALEAAAARLAAIPADDSIALELARRDLVVPLARAGRWTDALAAWSRCGPAPCRGVILLDLLSLAQDHGPATTADLLAQLVVDDGRSNPAYVECGAFGSWSATTVDRVRRLVRCERLLAAEVVTRMPLVEHENGWQQAHALALLALGRQARGDTAVAAVVWLGACAAADGSGFDASEQSRAWGMLADTLLAGGWRQAAEAALRRGLADARLCPPGNLRASALAGVARRSALLDRGESAGLLHEAMAEARGVEPAYDLARALADIGVAHRDTAIPVDAEAQRWLSEILAQRPPWTPTLSQ